MAKEKTPRQNAAPAPAQSGQDEPGQSVAPASTQNEQSKPNSSSSGKKSSGKKNNRPQIGGTAVTGAKSTLPKQISTSNNPQQQEIDSYNRTMRRRMENIGAGPYAAENRKVKTPMERRKEKLDRLKQRRTAQAEAIKRSLPGGKLKTDTSRAVRMVIVVAILVVLLITVFVVLRLTGVIS